MRIAEAQHKMGNGLIAPRGSVKRKFKSVNRSAGLLGLRHITLCSSKANVNFFFMLDQLSVI